MTKQLAWITIENDELWPETISDGLELLCALCNQKVQFDYHVNDEFWHSVVPASIRRDVICLPCLDKLATDAELNVALYLESVQFIGNGKTISLIPSEVYVYSEEER